MKGGFLIPKPDGLHVSFVRLTWMQSPTAQNKIVHYFGGFGYAEAEPLQYERRGDGIYVISDRPEQGFCCAEIADQAIASIPF